MPFSVAQSSFLTWSVQCATQSRKQVQFLHVIVAIRKVHCHRMANVVSLCIQVGGNKMCRTSLFIPNTEILIEFKLDFTQNC
jgi:hypothetical protein